MKQMHIRMDDELYSELSTYSVVTDQTMQSCVREAVAYYMTEEKENE